MGNNYSVPLLGTYVIIVLMGWLWNEALGVVTREEEEFKGQRWKVASLNCTCQKLLPFLTLKSTGPGHPSLFLPGSGRLPVGTVSSKSRVSSSSPNHKY